VPAPAAVAAVSATGGALDSAVEDLARRFRLALEPPADAAVTLDPGQLRARFAEPLPEHGRPDEGILE
jgi:hypothetical protein